MVLLVGHLWSNYLAVCSVTFNTLNRQRLIHLLESFHENPTAPFLTPQEVAKKESIIYDPRFFRSHLNIFWSIGRRCTFCTSDHEARRIFRSIGSMRRSLEDAFGEEHFIVVPVTQNSACIMLRAGATPADKIKAYVIAYEIAGKPIDPGLFKGALDVWERFRPEAVRMGWDFETDAVTLGATTCLSLVKDGLREKKTV